jgi:hypothetical protein
MSFVSTYLIYTFVNNVPTTAPGKGSGVVAVNIVNPETQTEPVKGSGIVALEIKPLS